MASQALWRVDPKEAKGLDGTLAYDWSPPNINRNNTQLTAGLRFNEPLPLHIHNTMSLGYVQNQLSQQFDHKDVPFKPEQALNSTRCWIPYRCSLLQPVMQYYANVGGGARSARSFRIPNESGVLGPQPIAKGRSSMNIGGLVSALLPVFFVLALGYFAGKRNAFDADQAAGLSKLALSFALPASLFVSMTDIPKDLLLQQGRLVLALILSHAGLFLVAWLGLGFVKSLHGTPAIIYALMLSTSATPVFGLAVLGPILGPTSAGTVGLVALAINLTVPPAVILLEMDAAAKNQTGLQGSFETKRRANRV